MSSLVCSVMTYKDSESSLVCEAMQDPLLMDGVLKADDRVIFQGIVGTVVVQFLEDFVTWRGRKKTITSSFITPCSCASMNSGTN